MRSSVCGHSSSIRGQQSVDLGAAEPWRSGSGAGQPARAPAGRRSVGSSAGQAEPRRSTWSAEHREPVAQRVVGLAGRARGSRAAAGSGPVAVLPPAGSDGGLIATLPVGRRRVERVADQPPDQQADGRRAASRSGSASARRTSAPQSRRTRDDSTAASAIRRQPAAHDRSPRRTARARAWIASSAASAASRCVLGELVLGEPRLAVELARAVTRGVRRRRRPGRAPERELRRRLPRLARRRPPRAACDLEPVPARHDRVARRALLEQRPLARRRRLQQLAGTCAGWSRTSNSTCSGSGSRRTRRARRQQPAQDEEHDRQPAAARRRRTTSSARTRKNAGRLARLAIDGRRRPSVDAGRRRRRGRRRCRPAMPLGSVAGEHRVAARSRRPTRQDRHEQQRRATASTATRPRSPAVTSSAPACQQPSRHAADGAERPTPRPPARPRPSDAVRVSGQRIGRTARCR